MDRLIKQLQTAYPDISFAAGDRAYWSPQNRTVTYVSGGTKADTYALLHELGHALLGHTDFISDADLIHKEAEAWDKASKLAKVHGAPYNAEHAQDCLDTYRDWMHRRSLCPSCAAHGAQEDRHTYTCLNCGHVWYVTASRLCRPYRRSQTASQTI